MPDALDDDAQAALSAATRQLQDLQLSGPAKTLTRLMVSTLRRRKTEDIREVINGWRLDLLRVDGVLSGIAAEVETAEQRAAADDPLGSTWWRLRSQEIVRNRQAPSPAATTDWIDAWLRGLTAEQWDRCDEVLRLPGGSDMDQKLADPMRRLTSALRTTETLKVAGAAGELLANREDVLGADGWIKLGVLQTRALLAVADHAAAWQIAQKTLSAAEATEPAGRVSWLASMALAVVAEVMIEQDALEPAEDLLYRALKSDEPAPDVYLANARLAMAEGLPDRANDLYDEAIINSRGPAATRRRVDLVRPQLLRPVPGNLLWRLSRLTDDPAKALKLLNRALDQGIQGSGPVPEREALSEKAKLLREAKSPEAGAACYAAGVAFSESGSPARARALLRKACQLDPDVAEHHWSYADAVREQAVDADEIVNAKQLQEAAAHLASGFKLRKPNRSEAWVLLSAALIAYYTRQLGQQTDQAPSLLCERALLLAPDNQVAFGFLATFLRLEGLPQKALDAATDGLQAGNGHPFTAARQAQARLDLGQYQEAIAETTRSLTDWPDHAELISQLALALIRRKRYADALEVLRGDDERLTYLRAGCLALRKDHAGARAEARATWVDRELLSSKAVAAWAAFQCGELDAAIAVQSALLERSPSAPAFLRDLGQMLLARGNDEQELAEGERLLRRGIETTPTVHDLVHMTEMEFVLLRLALPAGRSLPVLAELTRQAADRIGKLRSITRPDDDPAEIAVRARTAMARREPVAALHLYERLCRDHEVSEAQLGLARAAQALLDRGDRAVHDRNDLAAAHADWERLLDIEDLLDSDSTIPGELAGRLAFSKVELTETQLPASIAPLAQRPKGDSASALEKVFWVFARDVPTWWNHRQALLDSAKTTEDRALKRELARLVERLPLDAVYGLRRDAVPETDMLPVVSPIEVRVDAAHAQLRQNAAMGTAVTELRTILAREMGVQIPGVRVVSRAPVKRGTRVLLYDQVVADLQLPDDLTIAVPELAGTLERVVRAQLYRLIVVDDIPLWLRDWEPTRSVPDGSEPPTPAARLRVARILRLLLRERVPVIDRTTILAGCREMENLRQPHGPMDTLRVVRRRLGAHQLGLARGAEPARLPVELERRAAAGLNPEASSWAWTMERDQSAELIADLRDWLNGQSGEVVPIVVDDPHLRPFVWRLLATEATRIRILATEELS